MRAPDDASSEMLLAGGGTVLSKPSVEAMLQGRVLRDEPPRRTYGFGVVERQLPLVVPN